MTSFEILNIVLGGGLTVLGWFARELWSAVKELRLDLIALKANLSDQYVRKDDFREFRRELLIVLQRIEDKLDHKVDK